MQHFVWSAPAIEAGVDGFEHFGKRREVPVVRCEASGQLPDSFDRTVCSNADVAIMGTVYSNPQLGTLRSMTSHSHGGPFPGVLAWGLDKTVPPRTSVASRGRRAHVPPALSKGEVAPVFKTRV